MKTRKSNRGKKCKRWDEDSIAEAVEEASNKRPLINYGYSLLDASFDWPSSERILESQQKQLDTEDIRLQRGDSEELYRTR